MKSVIVLGCMLSLVGLVGCGDDPPKSGIDEEQVGTPCETADQCYPEVDSENLLGSPVCLDRVDGGYCTHECTADADCCALENECRTDLRQVCGPLESAPSMYCLVACEAEDFGDTDEEETFCETYVHPEFHCRSTGGGAENRKVCLPN